MEIVRIAIFYLSEELDLKDIEKELFTPGQEKFQLFFFHNKNLHFSKDIIKYQTLVSKFDLFEPEFKFGKNEIIMKKKINIDMNLFETEIDYEFSQYKSRINYRIDSIFQTFSMFNKLYKDRSIVFIFPFQLYEKFLSYIHDLTYTHEELDKNDNSLKYFDVFYWINYFSKFTPNYQPDNILESNHITKILKINT